MFELEWTDEAKSNLAELKANKSKSRQYRAVIDTLKFLAENPRHNSLETHEFTSLRGPNREKVFEAYAQQRTPAAYRVFWCYASTRGKITIIAITPHPFRE